MLVGSKIIILLILGLRVFWFRLNCLFVLFAFAVLGLVSSVLHQEIGREERLRNDLFTVQLEVKP